ncbi:MAG: hypothetical protein JWQ38_89 [Flavipsychrobacter sp.]|nr:hypothetical protein [Flavipsychrobacter sp.]
MNTLKAIIIVLLLSVTKSLYAQTTDTIHRADTTIHPAPDQVVIDTPVIAGTAKDTIVNKPKAPHTGYTINGKVVDANTGEGIPFAPVFFYHTQSGTAADLDGNFVFNLEKLPADTLRIEALGYKSANRILRSSQHDYNFIIDMERSTAALAEFVFHAGEDPAIVLMRKVIEKKPDNNPDKVENYQYKAYNRLEADLQRLTKSQFAKMPILKSYTFVFDNLDTQSEAKPYLPLYLTETISDYYFRAHPKKQREFIKATMVKGVNNENVDKYLGSLYQNINIYRNYIPVFDKKFVSPISNEGLFYYKYKIIDTQKAYGYNIILVQFRPKREGENCFVGDFWVVDSVYAIQRMSMDVPKLANINWVNKVSLYQEFAPVDSFWFCTKDKFIAEFSAYNSKKLPGMIGRKTTTYHNIKINDPETAKILDDPQYKEDIIRSDSARKHSDEWWATSRPDTLSKNEKAIYKMVDTINSMHVTTVYKNTITFLSSGVKDFGPIQLGPYYYIYSKNPVEGHRFRFSFGTPRSIKNAHYTGYVAYGTRDKEVKYGGTGLWILDRHPRMYLYGSYAHDINPPVINQDQLATDNIFSSLFRKPGVKWKLAFKDDARFEFYKEYFGGFSHKLILQHSDFTPYDPLPYRGIFFDKFGKQTTNVVSSEVGLELRYAYKEKYVEGQYLRLNIGSKYPVLDLEITAGLKDLLNSGYDYQKARFSISESINVPPLGHISYRLFTGKYFGKLPYPLLEIHPGNDFLYYNQFAFEMMNTYEFISDEYAGFNFEHNIGGGIFNHIPAVKKLKLRQFWTAKGVIGSLSPENQQLNLTKGAPFFRTLKGDPYLEIGTGVSNILEVFRLDFVWRVTPKPIPGESKEKYFGIFGSVRFEF